MIWKSQIKEGGANTLVMTGNNKNCRVKIKIREGERLKLQMWGRGVFPVPFFIPSSNPGTI